MFTVGSTGTNEKTSKLYDNMKNIKNTQQLLYEALLLQSGNNMQTVKQFLLMSNKAEPQHTGT